jgi:uncharacterized membrane protein
MMSPRPYSPKERVPFGFVASVLVGFFAPTAVVPGSWPVWAALTIGVAGALVAGLTYTWARRRK